jgi:hypothetical protein
MTRRGKLGRHRGAFPMPAEVPEVGTDAGAEYHFQDDRRLFGDQGMEFHGVFADWCVSQNLLHQCSVPRAPWSNGRVERRMSELIKSCTGLILDGHSPSWSTLLPRVELDLNSKALQSLEGFSPREVWEANLPGVNWDDVRATIFARRKQSQLAITANGAHKFHKFRVGDIVLVSKHYWSSRAGGAGDAQLYEMVPKWVGPWKVVRVLESGYSVDVERAYAWKPKRRGRRLSEVVSMSIRYIKSLFFRPEDWPKLQELAKQMHEKLFGW